MKRKIVYVIAAATGILGAGVLSPVALGSGGSGVTATPLVTANFDNTVHLNSDRVKLQTKDPTDVLVQKFTFDAGSYTGWHHHPGVVLIAVASGSVTVWDSECNQKTYGPGLPNGAVLTESGDEPGQVTSADGATTYATFVAPSADPPVFRIEDDPPPCA